MTTNFWFLITENVRKALSHSSPSRAFPLSTLMFACLGLTSAVAITVTNNNDSGPGSLRQAISDASPGDTIDFDSSLNGQTITLTSGELLIDKDLTIAGLGTNLLTISGNHASRVFHMTGDLDVTISGLTIANGFSPGAGGGIFGGSGGSLTIVNSTLSGNSSDSVGGGIYNFNGHATITNSSLRSNLALNGGGIFNDGGSLIIANSTLNDNLADIGNGGGIFNRGWLTITNSTLSGNAAAAGGGIFNRDSPLTIITNTTLSGNSANPPFGDGGAIFNVQSPLEIGNTILKAGARGQNIVNAGAFAVTSHGYNISSDPGGGILTGPGDHINTDPQLVSSVPEDNGGPTFTFALMPGSPAIDAGDPTFNPDQYDPYTALDNMRDAELIRDLTQVSFSRRSCIASPMSD